MKKVTLSLALLGAAFGAHAQIATGTKLLSGSIGYSQAENKTENAFYDRKTKTQNFNLSPTIGYFVAENLAVGATLDFNSTRTKGTDYTYYYPYYPSQLLPSPILYEFDNKTRTINAGAFARYYKFVGEKVAFFGQAGAGYTNVYSNNNSGDRPQGFYGNLLPGFTFFPTNKFALELTARGLSYSRVSVTTGQSFNGNDDIKSIQNTFDVGLGLKDLRVGAAFYLGR